MIYTLGEGVEGTDEGELGRDVEADPDHDTSSEDMESVSVAGTESTTSQSRPTSPSEVRPVAKETQKAGRKRRKEDRIEKIMNEIVENILKSQADSDKRYYELEEKRMHLEALDKERNEKIRKEEREFQLKMMTVIMTQSPGPSMYSGPAHYILPFYSPTDYGTQDGDDD